MKKALTLLIAMALLLTLSACTDGPLVVVASPEPSPEPTPEVTYQEDVYWPEEGLFTLLPRFPTRLDVLTQTGDESFFVSFYEPDSGIIDNYLVALKEAGFTEVEEENDILFIATHEDSDGLLRVQLLYEGGYGTLQLSDNRED